MRRALIYAVLPLISLTLACGGGDKDEDDDFSDDTAGGGSGGEGSGEGSGSSDGVSPSILEADAWCYLHDTGDTAYFWVAAATVDDPQGVTTVESLQPDDAVKIYSGDAEVSSQPMVCNSDGACTASFNADQVGVSCTNATSYTFSITVIDEDGNVSEAVEVTGREGSSAAGVRVRDVHLVELAELQAP